MRKDRKRAKRSKQEAPGKCFKLRRDSVGTTKEKKKPYLRGRSLFLSLFFSLRSFLFSLAPIADGIIDASSRLASGTSAFVISGLTREWPRRRAPGFEYRFPGLSVPTYLFPVPSAPLPVVSDRRRRTRLRPWVVSETFSWGSPRRAIPWEN